MKLTKILTENVETEKTFFLNLLKKLYPSIPEEYDNIIIKLIQIENMLHDETLKAKSRLIIKYLNENPERQGEQPGHVKDRIFNDLKKIIIAKNKEYYISRHKSDKYNKIFNILKKELPKLNLDELSELADKFISTGKDVDHIYGFIDGIVKKQDVKSKLIAQLNSLSLFKLEWEESEILETHIDDKHKKEKPHRLLTNTSVCVRFKNYFEQYSEYYPIYLINKLNNPYIIITYEETKTSKDDKITEEQFIEIREIAKKDELCYKNIVRYFISYCTNHKMLDVIYNEYKEDSNIVELLASNKNLSEETSNDIYENNKNIEIMEILAELSPHDSIINKILPYHKNGEILKYLLSNASLSKQNVEKIFNIYKSSDHPMYIVDSMIQNKLFNIQYIDRLFSIHKRIEVIDSFIKNYGPYGRNRIYTNNKPYSDDINFINLINEMSEFLKNEILKSAPDKEYLDINIKYERYPYHYECKKLYNQLLSLNKI